MRTSKKTPQKVYVNVEFIATITCQQCDKPHTIHVDDLLLISFSLDNAKQTPMKKWVVVRWVNGQRIGTEFHDIDLYDKEMGVYLMPI